MINTHIKFTEKILGKQGKRQLFKMFQEKGYKGTESDVISDFLFATVASDAYMYDPYKISNAHEELTEEEYFQVLIKEMNINY